MTKKIGLEEANQRLFDKHGESITIVKYHSMNSPVGFECSICGNRWSSDGYNVISAGTGCPECHLKRIQEDNGRRLSEEIINKFIVSENCAWLSGKYENNTSKLMIKFECGCVGEISYNNFKNGRRCREHRREEGAIKRRTKTTEMKNFIEDNNFTFIEIVGDNNGRRTIVKYMCSFGHISERYYKDFLNHPTCGVCSIEGLRDKNKNKQEDIEKVISEKQCILLNIIKYNNRRDSLLDIEFSCGHVEQLSFGNFQGRKSGLCVECELEKRSGETSYGWKGGLTPLTNYIRKNIKDWNNYCANYYNYTCVITGLPMEHIHHLQSFNSILIETMNRINISIKKNVEDYSEDELKFILDEFLVTQDKYPIGVPIVKNVHHIFHRFYGRGNNTPEQFYEFVDRIKSGEIEIN